MYHELGTESSTLYSVQMSSERREITPILVYLLTEKPDPIQDRCQPIIDTTLYYIDDLEIVTCIT